MTRWFRFYESALDDPKVQRLPPVLFKTWVNLLCLASRGGGRLPSGADIAFALRLDEDTAKQQLTDLRNRGLLDVVEGALEPHNWSARQFKSDSSAERVAKHRAAKKGNVTAPIGEGVTATEECNVTPAVTVTPPEQSRTETEADPVPDGTAVASLPAQPDWRDICWTDGVPGIERLTGKTNGSARAFLGQLVKHAQDDCRLVLEKIQQAEKDRVVDPASWLVAAVKSQPPPTASNAMKDAVARFVNGGLH